MQGKHAGDSCRGSLIWCIGSCREVSHNILDFFLKQDMLKEVRWMVMGLRSHSLFHKYVNLPSNLVLALLSLCKGIPTLVLDVSSLAFFFLW